MHKNYTKKDFPLDQLRRYLEPSPTLIVSSAHGHAHNLMTMNWYSVMEFTPALIGCVIAQSNYSFDLIRKSKACVLNIPTADMIDTIVKIGNSDGDAIDKFAVFGLTPAKASHVKAPLIKECYANIECKLHDAKLVKDYNFFIFEAVKAHVATRPKYPKTIGYRGEGVFMFSGENITHKRGFRAGNL